MSKNNSINNFTESLNVITTLTASTGITCTTGNIVAKANYIESYDGDFKAYNSENNTVSSAFNGFKDRASGIISNGDYLGVFSWRATDTISGLVVSAQLTAITENPALGNIPGKLTVWTMASSGVRSARFSISTEGVVSIAAPISGTALNVLQDITATTTIKGSTIYATGDNGGVPATIGLTNVSDLSLNGAGVFTIKSKTATNSNSTGFVKFYIGATPYYIPAFTTPAP